MNDNSDQSIEPMPCQWDIGIECLMVALLAFMPLAYGAVHAWSEQVVLVLIAAITLCLTVKLLVQSEAKVVWSWAYLPIGLFLALAVFQLVPLTAGLMGTFSSNTVATKTSLLGDLADAESVLQSMTLSFYPNATKHDLRLVLAVATVFFVVVNVYRRPDQIKRLLVAIVVIGAVIALLAIAQFLTGTEKIYWRVPISKQAVAGSFVNYSHYSQFMNLSMGCALALLLVKFSEQVSRRRSRSSSSLRSLDSLDLKRRLKQPGTRPLCLLTAMLVLGAVTIFLSLSKGGMISVLLAGSFTTMVLASRRSLSSRAWILVMVGLVTLVILLYAGFDAVYDRMATLGDFEKIYADRSQILEDIIVMASQFPFLGTGLGTHELVYPMFDRGAVTGLATHAENEYAQLIEETGIVGFVLMFAFAGVVWFQFGRLVHRQTAPIQVVAIGLGYGLMAIMIHSFSDFGQHLPANACLTAVMSGLLISLARMGTTPNHQRTRFREPQMASSVDLRPSVSSLLLRVVALLLVLPMWGWVLIGANSARAAEAHSYRALAVETQLRKNGWLGRDVEFANLIARAAAASDQQPDDVKYRFWLNYYRWRSISRMRDEQTGDINLTSQAVQFTQRIVEELHKARQLCPTFGPLYSVAGQLERFVLDQPAGAQHIRKGFALAPNDPTACFLAGLLEAHEKNVEASIRILRYALELDGGLFKDIVSVYVHDIGRPDLAADLAGDEVGRLMHVVETISGLNCHVDLAEQVRAKVIESLRIRCEQPDAPSGVLATMANIYHKDGDYEKATEYYRRALGGDYGQVVWRLSYARVLADDGYFAEAIYEARVCLRLRPQMDAAKNLIANLSVRVQPPGEMHRGR